MLLQTYLPPLLKLVEHVSQHILSIYHQSPDIIVDIKDDHSPVTAADRVANQLIIAALQQLTPDIPIISEESTIMPFAQRKHWGKCWLVDPLDGTREFIAKTDDFSINIALIADHRPILGVIHAPVTGITYYATQQQACKRSADGTLTAIKARKLNCDNPLMIASRRHANNLLLQQFFSSIGNYQQLSRGSALKFCLIAEGLADIYPRFGDTSEWDTAAGQCIVEAAGGHVVDIQMQPLRYNTRQSLLNPHFIAIGNGLNFLTEWSKTHGE